MVNSRILIRAGLDNTMTKLTWQALVILGQLCLCVSGPGFAQDVCPAGYSYLTQQGGRFFCRAAGDIDCFDGQYRCGTSGNSCCAIGQDNYCPAGFGACKPEGATSAFGQSKPYCCTTPQSPEEDADEDVTPNPTPDPAENIFSYVFVFCESKTGSGHSQFLGRSSVSCADAHDKALEQADEIGCSQIGSNYSEIRRERIGTPTCPK